MTGHGANDNDETNDNQAGPVESGPAMHGLVREGLGKEALRPPLPKRFYKQASVAEAAVGFAVLLDGRPVKTPAKAPFLVPAQALAEAIAAEWAAQGERIDPAAMPLTRLANTTIDAVAGNMAAVAGDIVAYAGTDALCYRAAPSDAVADLQAAAWDPVLAWAADALGAQFVTQSGIVHVSQPDATLAAIAHAITGCNAWQLAPLHVITTLTGSAVLALAVARGAKTAADAWAAAHVDEDFQIARWGSDEEAELRRAGRWTEMEAAARFLEAVRG